MSVPNRLKILEQRAEAQRAREQPPQRPPFDHDAYKRAFDRWHERIAAENPTWTPAQVGQHIAEQMVAGFRRERWLKHLDEEQPAAPAKENLNDSQD